MAPHVYNLTTITKPINENYDLKKILEAENITFSGDTVEGQIQVAESGSNLVIKAYGTQQGSYQMVVTTTSAVAEAAGRNKGKYACTVTVYNATYENGIVNGVDNGIVSTKTTYVKTAGDGNGVASYRVLDSKNKLLRNISEAEFNSGNRTIVDPKKVLVTVTYKNGTPQSQAINLQSDILANFNIVETPIQAIKSGKAYKGTWLREEASSTADNETFTLGTNNDSIIYDLSHKNGNDTVNAAIGETVTLSFDNNANVTNSYSLNGNDVILAMNKGDDFTGNDYSKLERVVNKTAVGYIIKDTLYNWNGTAYEVTISTCKAVSNAEFGFEQKFMKYYGVNLSVGTNVYYIKNYGQQNQEWHQAETSMGTVAFKNYLKLAQDNAVIGNQHLQTILQGTEGIGTLDFEGDDEKKIIQGTFLNETITGGNNDDILKGGAGDDIIEGTTGNDQLYGEDGNNTIVFDSGDGTDTVFSGKGEDTLKFKNLADQDALKNLSYKVVGKDLQIFYTENDSVIIKNYYNKTSSVKKIQANNGDTLNLENIVPAAKGAKIYNINNGLANANIHIDNMNSEINFSGDFGQHIVSSGAGNYTDKLVFKDYSATNDDLYFGYNFLEQGYYDNDDLLISADKNNSPFDNNSSENTVIYQNYFSSPTHNVVIQDKYRTYHLAKFGNETSNLNLNTGSYKKQNNVVFLHGDTDAINNITSNTGYNYIHAYGDALNYTYKGGVDEVSSENCDTNDVYNIDVFNAKTDVTISDAGGNDTININTKSDNLRIMFMVYNEDSLDPNSDNTALVVFHKNAFSAKNVSMVFDDDYFPEHCGIIDIECYSENYQNGAAGIEKYTTTDYMDGLNMNAWINVIKERIAGWCANHEQGALENIMAGNLSPDANSLFACYNISYNQAMELYNQA